MRQSGSSVWNLCAAALVLGGVFFGRDSNAAEKTPLADATGSSASAANATASTAAPASKPGGLEVAETPGLGEPGKLLAISLADGPATLSGSDARRQLLVDGKYASGQTRDLTSQVVFAIAPPGIVEVDQTGFVVPLADGDTTITVTAAGGLAAKTELHVEGFASPKPIHFANQIVPIFTKAGCNAGGCHGKLSGQNGFRLSLLGFYPQDDYDFLVKEDRGRRLFPAAPARSLLLKKATNQYAHGGGQRLTADSIEYQLLAGWIGQGMPLGSAKDAQIVRVEVSPRERLMDRNSGQQLTVQAYYSDGTSKDVTRLAQFEPNSAEMAEVAPTGLVRTLGLTGDVAVMIRFQGQVDVFRATLPLGIKVEQTPPPRGKVDEAVFAKLKTLGLPPSALCSDAAFVRRAALDIAGRLPTAAEAQSFLSDTDPAKRDKWIDRLLASHDYADFFAAKWNSILRNRRTTERYARGTYVFREWLFKQFDENKPYDRIVRDLLTATGDLSFNPPVAWYRAVPTSNEQVEDTAQLFLGLRIQCARCHHHPYEKWSQHDYYGFAAFFSQVGRKNGVEMKQEEGRIFHKRGEARAVNPRNNESLRPTGLGGEPLVVAADKDPREVLVDWMIAPDNPFFARALVNRYWKHFFGRGVVDPEDDMRATNPATNPQLLDALADGFRQSGFDLKQLVRTICQSQTYQLSADPNEYNAADKQNYSRYYPKRLSAEVLYDALNQATGTRTRFTNLPEGYRAVQLPDNGFENYFLSVFGKPRNESACECERSSEATLAQTLHMLNSREVQSKLNDGTGRAALLAADKDRSDEQKLGEMYLAVYARLPAPDELKYSLEYLSRDEFKDKKTAAYEDILWALINAKEFLFNH
jgi:hypothetical protein